MSMILDALTRAEHERQLEKQPDLKFVTPVKPQQNKQKKIWFYVGLGVIANALILFFIVRALSGDTEDKVVNEMDLADGSTVTNQINTATSIPSNIQPSPQPVAQAVKPTSSEQEIELAANSQLPAQVPVQSPEFAEATADNRPLAMEANDEMIPQVDRPLFYESKQPKSKTAANSKPVVESKVGLEHSSSATTKGNVSFSSTELNADDAIPISNTPKLLIDQGNDDENNMIANARVSSSAVPNLRDLPESSRASLNQYEVNVHVFDDNPTRRFVLINMDKYKEGDRIAGNGPLVQEITIDGVVVDYGSGRALLPPK